VTDREPEIIPRLRRSYDAFNRGDYDAAMEIAHPEVELVRPGGLSPLKGAEALRAWMEPDAIEVLEIEPLEFRIEANKVLVRTHSRARGAGSGIEVDTELWYVWTIDDEGRATRVEYFLPHQKAAAFEAAGIVE
jgi:ketosteroid isomerase-like protein